MSCTSVPKICKMNSPELVGHSEGVVFLMHYCGSNKPQRPVSLNQMRCSTVTVVDLNEKTDSRRQMKMTNIGINCLTASIGLVCCGGWWSVDWPVSITVDLSGDGGFILDVSECLIPLVILKMLRKCHWGFSISVSKYPFLSIRHDIKPQSENNYRQSSMGPSMKIRQQF